MPKPCTKAADNVYCQARIKASRFNDAFKSREGAAPYVGCEKDTLAKYELGLLRVPSDIVVMMADAYNAPELLNHYCVNECPIGNGRVEPLMTMSVELATLRILQSTKDLQKTNETLMQVVEDGVISEDEKPMLAEIINNYEKMQKSVNELKLWAEKNNII
jgi:hypothetical protein